MTENETIKILSIMKAAYPSTFKGLTREEGFGMIRIWQMQFADIPAELVMAAVNRLIGKNAFPPSVAEVKKELKELRDEAENLLWMHTSVTGGMFRLPPEKLEECRAIINALATIDGSNGHMTHSITHSTAPLINSKSGGERNGLDQ